MTAPSHWLSGVCRVATRMSASSSAPPTPTMDHTMENQTCSGQARLLTLEELAIVVRLMREALQWSQETLAELAGIHPRTIQRVENAKSASFDTRRALARAFEFEDIDAFNKPFTIPTAEEIQAEKERIERDYVTVPAHPITTGYQLAQLAEASTLDVIQPGFQISRDAHEVFAALTDYFHEYRDCASDYPARDKLAIYDELQEMIDDLHKHQVAVHYATRDVYLRTRGEQPGLEPMKAQITYLIAFERGKAPEQFSVQKKPDFSF